MRSAGRLDKHPLLYAAVQITNGLLYVWVKSLDPKLNFGTSIYPRLKRSPELLSPAQSVKPIDTQTVPDLHRHEGTSAP